MESQWKEKIRDLHQQLHTAIETRSTQDCRIIVDQLCHHVSSPQQTSDCLSFYSHIEQLQSPLLHAIAKGNPDASLYLLKKGCNPFLKDHPKFEKSPERVILNKCIFKILGKPGFEPIVMQLLDLSDGVVAITGNNSETVLHVICKKKLTSLLNLVLCSPVHSQMLFIQDKYGLLPMHIAARHNFVDFFRLVFDLDSSKSLVVTKQDEYQSPEKSDTIFQSVESIPEYINKKTWSKTVTINCPIKGKKSTALHIAAKERNIETVKVLLERGANVHASAEGSKTALMDCLDFRGDVTICDAVMDTIYQVCKLLIQSGASVNLYSNIPLPQRFFMATNDAGTPLHLAASLGFHRVLELLLNNGSDVMALSTNMGRIPLHFAVEKGHNECVEILLSDSLYSNGFLASYHDYALDTLLHSAYKCSDNIFQKLIDLGCPLDRPNVNNMCPLDKAITSNNMNFIHMLLKRQPYIVNVHMYQDSYTNSPLYLAARMNKLPLIQILLSYGADIYARAYGKNMACKKAYSGDCFENAVYLCEQMSRPFTLAEKEELLSREISMDEDLACRLRRRLNTIPSLVAMCLDTVRQRVIRNRLCYKDLDSLPVPLSVIKALRYQNSLS